MPRTDFVYLDSAATTLQKPKSVAEAMSAAVSTLSSPGRGGHRFSMRAAEVALDCRELAARLFNVADPANIVFTSNATHALNIAINSRANRGSRVVVSGYEHNSVMRPLYALGADIRIACSSLFDADDTLRAFQHALDDGADLVVTTHISNVFGFVLPIDRIARLCRERNVPLIIDASQSAGSVPIDAEALGADFIAMPGHKGLYGPQGTGLLICGESDRPLRGIMHGGSGSDSLSAEMPDFLPDALEAGTHNMPGIAGLRAGLRFVLAHGVRAIGAHSKTLISVASHELSRIPGVTVFSAAERFDNNDVPLGALSFKVAGRDCEDIAELLSARGIAVRAGLHCAPEAHRTAGTLDSGTVRASVSAFSKESDIMRLAAAVESITHKK